MAEKHNAESGFIELVNNHNVFDGGLDWETGSVLNRLSARVVTEGQVGALRC